jgi:hypothetical protein
VKALPESAHTDLAHSLRASLDGRKQNIKVIFAGSSEATLRRMFGRSTEPFYNWAPLEPFELLGAEFVRAMVLKANRLSRYPRAQNDALAAFEALKPTPEFFRQYLSRYLAYADMGPKAALLATEARKSTREHISESRGAGLLSRAQATKSTSLQHVTEVAVLPSRIEQLPDLEGFLKFASTPEWRRVRLRH